MCFLHRFQMKWLYYSSMYAIFCFAVMVWWIWVNLCFFFFYEKRKIRKHKINNNTTHIHNVWPYACNRVGVFSYIFMYMESIVVWKPVKTQCFRINIVHYTETTMWIERQILRISSMYATHFNTCISLLWVSTKQWNTQAARNVY